MGTNTWKKWMESHWKTNHGKTTTIGKMGKNALDMEKRMDCMETKTSYVQIDGFSKSM
jgi:hypothetical protein